MKNAQPLYEEQRSGRISNTAANAIVHLTCSTEARFSIKDPNYDGETKLKSNALPY